MSWRGARHNQVRNSPGEHSWLWLRNVADTRAVLRFRKCGVVVETPAVFPNWSRDEYWNGEPLRKRAPRPACGGAACT